MAKPRKENNIGMLYLLLSISVTIIIISNITPALADTGEDTFFKALVTIWNEIWPDIYGLAKALFVPVIIVDLSILLFTHNEKTFNTVVGIIKTVVITMICMVLLNQFFGGTHANNKFLQTFKDFLGK